VAATEKETVDPVSLVGMAVESITAHKLRSFLVTLGILIGITAVIGNAAMVEGFQAYFEGQMQSLGSNFVTIRPGSAMGVMGPKLQESELLDIRIFDSVRQLPYVDDATASRTTFGTIKYGDEEATVFIVGAESGYLNARNREMVAGEPLRPQDVRNAVIADNALQSSTPALMTHFDLTISTDEGDVTERFRIKGIVEGVDTGVDIGIVYIPIRTLNTILGEEGYDEITLFAANVEDIDKVEDEAKVTLDRLFQVEPDRNPAEEDEQSEGFMGISMNVPTAQREYSITTQEDVLQISEDISSMIQMALVAIAGISLLVGGIGIANVMLVTVSERTREIGVMKAVGAKNRQVLIAFLFEAGFIGLLGGLLGLGLAALGTFTMVPMLFDVPGALPIQWVVIAIGISLAISILSGLYPAVRASRMDPVEALRTE
jgi:putative ABC transport system permease protein